MKASIKPISILLLAVAAKAEPLVDHPEGDVHDESLYKALNPAVFGESHDGALSQTQEQKTVICPEFAQNLYEGHVQYGPQTRFIIKNTASDPVVVTYVHRNGTEYSAANANFFPGTSDPDAMLAPGVSKVFSVHEGHVFHVRDTKTLELLMQHRAGLVPVENKYNREIPFCPDIESITPIEDENAFRTMRKFPQWKPHQIEEFNEDVELDIGYKNNVRSQSGTPCPVNLFYVQKNDNGLRRPPQFMERFSLLLGGNKMATCQDEDWDAETKYERTFLGHEFVARLAHDDSVVVDYFTVEPIKVQDCGNKKKVAARTIALANAVVVPIGKQTSMGEQDGNQTEWGAEAFQQLNATDSKRGLVYFKMYTE